MANFQKLFHEKNGDPLDVLSLVTEPVPDKLQTNEALVRFLYSPINPSDLYGIYGRNYPLKGSLPAVPGLEGVVEVIKGHTLQPGDHAVTRNIGLIPGFWRQQAVVDEKLLRKIPPEMSLELAATLVINPSTAYLMMKEASSLLKPGDVLIQNGANSALGQIIIQLAKLAGMKTINVIRDRPNMSETVKILKELGADGVITDKDFSRGLGSLNLGLSTPKLAFECVGGHAAADMVACLDNGGTMVIYGLLSGQPVHFNQADVLFRGIHIQGFLLPSWIQQHKAEEFDDVVSEVISLYSSGKLRVPQFCKFPLEQWKEAIKFVTEGYSNKKVLLQLNK